MSVRDDMECTHPKYLPCVYIGEFKEVETKTSIDRYCTAFICLLIQTLYNSKLVKNIIIIE